MWICVFFTTVLVAHTDQLVCWDMQIFNMILFKEKRQLHTGFYNAARTYIVQKGFVKQIGQHIVVAPVWRTRGICLLSFWLKCLCNMANL